MLLILLRDIEHTRDRNIIDGKKKSKFYYVRKMSVKYPNKITVDYNSNRYIKKKKKIVKSGLLIYKTKKMKYE